MDSSPPIAFVDTETTGLDPIRHMAWEVAVIRREPDGLNVEHLWQFRPLPHDLAVAEMEALRIGRYEERAAVSGSDGAADMLADGGPRGLAYLEACSQIASVLDGAVMVGSNPHFDASFLHQLLQPARTPWHYRPVDIATLAAGYLRGQGDAIRVISQSAGRGVPLGLPFSSRDLSRAVGVEPPGDGVAHTALGDARWARDVYDAVTGGRA